MRTFRAWSHYLAVCLKRISQGGLELLCDLPFLYEPPAQGVKAWVLSRVLGARVAGSALLVGGVRAINWGNISVGEFSYLARGVEIHASAPVSIGRACTLGPGVFISTGDHSKEDLSPVHRPLVIGDCVFVGARAVILGGVSIGDHAIIGAGAVVTRDVPECAICVGVPARLVATRTRPSTVWTVFGLKRTDALSK